MITSVIFLLISLLNVFTVGSIGGEFFNRLASKVLFLYYLAFLSAEMKIHSRGLNILVFANFCFSSGYTQEPDIYFLGGKIAVVNLIRGNE